MEESTHIFLKYASLASTVPLEGWLDWCAGYTKWCKTDKQSDEG